jgi:hypothetical protein
VPTKNEELSRRDSWNNSSVHKDPHPSSTIKQPISKTAPRISMSNNRTPSSENTLIQTMSTTTAAPLNQVGNTTTKPSGFQFHF